jgi:hypothetical protein
MSTAFDLRPCTLEGSLVRLEPLGMGHLDGLCAAGLDPELWRLTVSKVRDRSDMRRYVETAKAEQRGGAALPFATVWRATGEIIGSTRFGNAAPEHRRVEIGWTWLARPWQRSGANVEAKYLMLGHVFERWGVVRVERLSAPYWAARFAGARRIEVEAISNDGRPPRGDTRPPR